MLPVALEKFEPGIEARQLDIVIEIDGIGDLPIDESTGLGDVVVTCLGVIGDLGPQLGDFASVARRLAKGDHQPADIHRFFQRMNIALNHRDIGGEVIAVENLQLVVDGFRHAQADERRRAHQDQQPDRDAENLEADPDAHAIAPPKHTLLAKIG